jgi:hypothetical protein
MPQAYVANIVGIKPNVSPRVPAAATFSDRFGHRSCANLRDFAILPV